MPPIDRMLIEHTCQKLILQYARLNDAGHWEELANMYTDDAIFARPSAPHDLIHGKESILNSFKARDHRVTQHVVTGAIVDVVDSQSATAISTIQLYIGINEDNIDIPKHKLTAPVLGEFRDVLVNTREGWRFAERRGLITMK